jgi:phage tail-like protein
MPLDDDNTWPSAVAFSFTVTFGAASLWPDCSFREVSGIGAKMQTMEVVEGGENRFVHHLPVGVRYEPLQLKRGVAGPASQLVRWCKQTLEGGIGARIATMPLLVFLLDAAGVPLRGWRFDNAYPVEWSVGPFDAMKGEVTIETVKLRYSTSSRIL